MSLGDSIRRHPPLAYMIVAYAVSWATAIPLMTGAWPERLHLLVALGPTVAAVTVTAVVSGRQGLQSLLDRARDWRRLPGWVWWPVAFSPILYLGVAVAVAAPMGQLSDGIDWSGGFGDGGWLFGLVGAALAFGVFEEVGWRGFLLPRLQARRSAARASLVLWLIWAGWHAPMFAYHFDFEPMMIVGWLGSLYFGTVFLTFLNNSTRGSLLAVIVFHVSLDLASVTAGAISTTATIIVSILVIAATIVAARATGSANLSSGEKFTIVDETVNSPARRR